jgi:hypothetical protein
MVPRVTRRCSPGKGSGSRTAHRHRGFRKLRSGGCFLLAAGEDVKEVPAFVAHSERRKSPAKGKSELADAIAIARVTARANGLFSPHRNEALQDLKLLSDAYPWPRVSWKI